MAFEKIKELAKAVKTDPKAQETLQGLIKSADEDGIISFYADAAKRLGIKLTAEDIRETIAKEGRNQKDRTEKTSADVQALTDDETENVAGGSACIGYLEVNYDVDPECGVQVKEYKDQGNQWCDSSFVHACYIPLYD